MLSLLGPSELALQLAARIRERRLRRGWTQAEMAERAGLKLPTYVHFERSGQIALTRLIKILEVVDLLPEFERIGAHEEITGTALAQWLAPVRQRGRRRRSP